MMEAILTICTILGGIAALMYFWEKKNPGWLSRIKGYERAPAVPIDPSSLFAYVSSHPRPLALAQSIAERRGLEMRSIDSESAWLNEQVQVLGIKTIRELDDLVKQYGQVAVRLADYMTPKQPIDSGFVLGRVLEVVAIERGGKEGFRGFCTSLKHSTGGTGWAEEIHHAYQQIKQYG